MDESAMALIDAYLDGDLDAEGLARFEAWLLADRQHQVAFARAARMDTSLRVAVVARQGRQDPELESVTPTRPARRPKLRRASGRALRRRWPRYAAGLMAAAAIVVVACGVGWRFRSATPQESAPMAIIVGKPLPTVVITAKLNGQSVRLPVGAQCAGPCELTFDDGSRVQVDDAGRLRIDHLSGDTALTLLNGHLTADIAHQPSGSSFKVATAHLIVAVVGTRFEVATDPSTTSVAVTAGRVRVTDTLGLEHLVNSGERAFAGTSGLAERVLSVSPSGERPPPDGYASLTAAAAVARPGDLILILPGRHGGVLDVQNQEFIKCQGTAAAWITIAGIPGQRPIIESGAWDALHCENASFVKVVGLELTMNPLMSSEMAGNGLNLTRCHHILVENCIFRDLGGDGITATRSDHVRVERNRIIGCGHRSRWGQGGIGISSSLAMDDAPGPHTMISDNRITGSRTHQINVTNGEWTGGNGIGVYNHRPGDDGEDYPGYFIPILISGNLCADNDGSGISLFRTDQTRITGNLLHRNAAGRGGTCELGLFFATTVVADNNLLVPRADKKAVVSTDEALNTFRRTRVWGGLLEGYESIENSPFVLIYADENTRIDFRTLAGFPLCDAPCAVEVK